MTTPRKAMDAVALHRRASDMEGLMNIAGHEALQAFTTRNLGGEVKPDGTLVTEADRHVESVMREWLAQHYSQDGVVGEEGEDKSSQSGWTWVLDPIDGTASFSHGVPLWGTLVALRYGSTPVAGGCHLPCINLSAYGTATEATLLEGGVRRVISCNPSTVTLNESTLVTTGWDYFRMAGVENAYSDLARRAARTKGWSDCYGLWLLLAGRVDVVVEPLMHPWDIEWIFPIVKAAGLKLTDWSGQDAMSPHQCIVTHGGDLHEEVVSVLLPHATRN